MKQPPIKTKELSGSTVQIADGQNWEIASITAYGETPQGGTTEAPVALTGVDSVHVCGRNLLPLPHSQVSETKNGLNIAVNADGTITVSGTATAETYLNLNYIPASLYRLMGLTRIVPAYDYPVTKNGFTFFDLTIQPYGEFAITYIVITKGSVVNRTYHPYIIKSAEPLPYEPYQGSVTQLPIPRPLHKVGDVRDVCVTRQEYEGTEKLVVTYNVGFVELDGTEDVIFDIYGDTQKRIRFDLDSKAIAQNALKFSHGNPEGVPTVTGSLHASFNRDMLNRLQIATRTDTWTALGVTDTATAKTWLAAQKAAGTPVQVAYQLATPEVYATDPVDIDNASGPLTVMTGGEVEVTLTHRMLTPYTAWTIQYDSEGEYTGDFFNVEDYDRIKQNIEYLREYAYFLYGGFTLRGMVAVTVESYGYASTIDALDANLEAIAANTFRPPDMMPVKQWRGNQPPPGADDWNRIENTCLLLFEQFERQFACLPKLAFELKGSAF
jgi:hypothetical protein